MAAYAQTQVAVEKREEAERTVARAAVVDGDARVGELSRMLAGLGESDHARRLAAELLDRAAAARSVAP